MPGMSNKKTLIQVAFDDDDDDDDVYEGEADVPLRCVAEEFKYFSDHVAVKGLVTFMHSHLLDQQICFQKQVRN